MSISTTDPILNNQFGITIVHYYTMAAQDRSWAKKFKSLANSMKHLAYFVAVDCSEEKASCKRQKIPKKTPHLRMHVGGDVFTFEGKPSKAKPVKEWITENLPEVTVIKEEIMLDTWLGENCGPTSRSGKESCAVFYKSDGDVPLMWRALSLRHRKKFAMAAFIAPVAQEMILDLNRFDFLGSDDLPKIIVYCQGSRKRSFLDWYEGSFKGKPAKVMKEVHKYLQKVSLKKVCANKLVINSDSDFDMLKTSQIKRWLLEHKVSVRGLLEKEDYVRKVRETLGNMSEEEEEEEEEDSDEEGDIMDPGGASDEDFDL